MTGPSSTRPGFVAGEFLTRTYRVSGEAMVGGTPLLDQLNFHTELYIQLERIFVSPLLNPTVLTGNFKIGHMRKDSLGLVVLSQLRDGLPKREGQYMGRDHIDREVLIVVAGFEVRGSIRLHPSVNISNFIRTTPEHFIPVFNGNATLAEHREIVFMGGAVLVNRNRIEVFSVLSEK